MAAPQPEKLSRANLLARIDALFAATVLPAIAEADYKGFTAIYIRVSTTDQGERYSLPSQLRQLLLKANREGYRVRREFIFLDTHSGKVASRPGFDEFKMLVRSGAVKGALVYTVDRFARKTVDALTLAAEFKRHGVALDFVETPYEDTAYGRFTFTQMAAVAELIGEKIITDSKRGREEAMDEGWLPHRSAPYGYECLSKSDVLAGKSHPRIILMNGERRTAPAGERHPQLILAGNRAQEAAAIKVFQMIDNGTACHSVARYLNDAGILTAGKPGQFEPGLWSANAVWQMATNPTYAGRHTCSGRVFLCDQLIDGALFDRVQMKLEYIRQQRVGRPSKNQYLLREFLWCGATLESGELCGRRWISLPNKGYPCYLCGNIIRKPYERICFAPQVQCDVLERSAWGAIWGMLTDPAALLEMGEAAYAALAKPKNGQETRLMKEQAQIETALRNIDRRLNDGTLEYAPAVAGQIKAKRARLAIVGGELAAIGRVVQLPPLRQAQTALAELRGPDGEPDDYAGRRDILEALEGLKMTYLEGKLDIVGSVPLPEKNCLRGQHPQVNSLASIPFHLKVRVA
jgi:site-specific DNA recombinase